MTEKQEELISTLQRFYKEFGKSPTNSDCAKIEYLKGKNTYNRHFGCFGNALEAAGLSRNRRKAKILNDEELLNTLKDFNKKFNRSPTQTDCKNCDILASHSTYTKRFGSFTKALELANLTVNIKVLSDQELIETLIRFNLEYERNPNINDFKNVDYLYSITTYYNRFGSLTKAKELAGIKKDNLIDGLKRFYQEYNRTPRQEEYKIIDYLKGWGTYYYQYGSVNKALEIAGIKKSNTSNGQLELLDFIKPLYEGLIIVGDRKVLKGKELDILLPEINLAFEYNGQYWHSEDKISKRYHLNKTKECASNNIQLIHIFEYEWNVKKEIVKSRIANLLKGSNKIHARKCTVKEIDSNEAKVFLDANHIQGSCQASVKCGLFFEDKLVALMTFARPRFNKYYEYELTRYCNILNTVVVGGSSKLFNYFLNNYLPESIISYSDNRWNIGKLYEILGFKFSHSSEPNYWYSKNGRTFENRMRYQKHKLQNILNTYDSSLTEAENMRNNGYYRIFDCGNDVYVWKI